ncbi:MAG: TerB family tellurite resistance protein [Litoreibacter sp.]
MKHLLIIITFFIVNFPIISDAEARRRSGGSQKMHFIADTKLKNPDGGQISICYLTKTTRAIGIPLWRSLEQYVLSKDKCIGTEYFTVSGEKFKELHAANMLGADLPLEPKLPNKIFWAGSWGAAIVIPLILIGLFIVIRRQINKKRRHSTMGNVTRFQRACLDVMCHAALSDGTIEESEITLIQKSAENLTNGHVFSVDEVNKMIKTSEKKPTADQFREFGKGLNTNEKAMLLKGALMVVAADNSIDGKEKVFVGNLIRALGIPSDIVDQILAGNA